MLSVVRARQVGLDAWEVTTKAPSVGLHARQAYPPDMENCPKASLLYNANCPVCGFEIGQYARYAGKAGLSIRSDDPNTDARTEWGLDAVKAVQRLYVLHERVLTSGIGDALLAVRLRSQHPKSSGPPQGFSCADHRRSLGNSSSDKPAQLTTKTA